MIQTGGNRRAPRETCPTATNTTHRRAWDWTRVIWGEMPSTNRLSHGTGCSHGTSTHCDCDCTGRDAVLAGYRRFGETFLIHISFKVIRVMYLFTVPWIARLLCFVNTICTKKRERGFEHWIRSQGRHVLSWVRREDALFTGPAGASLGWEHGE